MKPNHLLAVVIAIIGIGALGWVLLSGGSTDNTQTGNESERVQVGLSIYPLQFLVEKIGGDQVELVISPSAGIDAHSFEPSARQVADLQGADLFVYHGQGLDAWAEELSSELPETVQLLEATELVPLIGHEDEHAHEEEEEEHEDAEDDHAHGEFDPHVWLDPGRMSVIAGAIADELSKIDPANAALYEERLNALTAELSTLDDNYSAGLANCALNQIIVSHDAFGYLADTYNFTTHSIAGLSPDAEPSAKRLAELTEEAEEIGTEHIFFEALTSSKLAETIANEVGAKTLVLDPIEGVTNETDTYLSLMESNLENLRTGMQCE